MKKNNSNIFSILSVFALGSYYVANPELFLAQDQNLNPKDNPHLKSQSKKPKSVVDKITDTFTGSNQEVGFQQWLATPDSTQAYDSWRQSPTGIKELSKEFEKTSDFKKNILKWAGNTKRDFFEFKKIAKKKSFYKDDFKQWKVNSQEGITKLRKYYVKDPTFVTNANKWINLADFQVDAAAYLQTPGAEKEYQEWIAVNDNILQLQDQWKLSPHYQTKKNAWLQKVNTKIGKQEWLKSSLGQQKLAAWKKTSQFLNQLQSFWKGSKYYQKSVNNWLAKSPTKKSLAVYRQDSSLWNTFFVNFKTSSLGQQLITNQIKNKKAFLDKKQEWITQEMTKTQPQNLFTPYYNSWRTSAEAITSLKPLWLATTQYGTKRNLWIDNHYQALPFADWKANIDLDPYYGQWKNTYAGKRTLQGEWKKTSHYATKKGEWDAKPETINEKKDIWAKLRVSSTSFGNWQKPQANINAAKNSWIGSPAYLSSQNHWIQNNPIKNSKTIWLQSDHAKNKYLTWSKKSLGLKTLQEGWTKTTDFETHKEKWAQDNFSFIDYDQWFNGQISKVDTYDKWQVEDYKKSYINFIDQGHDDLINEYQKTQHYTNLKTEWINKKYLKVTKKAWKALGDSQSSYDAWKQTSEGITTLQEAWKKSTNYQQKQQAWVSSNHQKMSFDGWKSSSFGQQAYEEWKATPQGSSLLKSDFDSSSQFTTKKQEWVNLGTSKRPIDAWINDDASTTHYDAWRTTNAGQEKLKATWSGSGSDPDFVSATNSWFDSNNPTLDSKTKWLEDAASDIAFEKWYNSLSLDAIQKEDTQVMFNKAYAARAMAEVSVDDWIEDPDGLWNWHQELMGFLRVGSESSHKIKDDIVFTDGNDPIKAGSMSYYTALTFLMYSPFYATGDYARDLLGSFINRTDIKSNRDQISKAFKRIYAEMFFNFRSPLKQYVLDLVKGDIKPFIEAERKGWGSSSDRHHTYTLINYWDYATRRFKDEHPQEHITLRKNHFKGVWKRKTTLTNKAYQEYKSEAFKNAGASFDTALNTWASDKSKGGATYQQSGDALTHYQSWTDPNPIVTTATNYQNHNQYQLDYLAYLNTTEANGLSKGLNLYLGQGVATSDYNAWVDPQGVSAFDASNQFTSDFATYKDSRSGFNVYLSNDQSNTDYHAWTDPQGEAEYLKSFAFYVDLKKYYQFNDAGVQDGIAFYKSSGHARSNYDADLETKKRSQFGQTSQYQTAFTNWVNTFDNDAKNLYKNHFLSDHDYKTWVDPNPRYQTPSDYTHSNQVDSDFWDWFNGIEPKYKRTNGFIFYMSTPQGASDFQSWVTSDTNDYYNQSASFQKDYAAFETLAWGMPFYHSSPQIQTSYQQWVYTQGENPYQASAQFDTDLGDWSQDINNGFVSYQKAAQFNSDKAEIVKGRFDSSQAYHQIMTSLKTLHSADIYQQSIHFTNDYNSWIDPEVRIGNKYELSPDFATDFATFQTNQDGLSQAYDTIALSDNDYAAYQSDLKNEDDYLNTAQKTSDLQKWGTIFAHGKTIFKTQPHFRNLAGRTLEKYQKSLIFKEDYKAFIKKTNDLHFDEYIGSDHLKSLYKKWNDPIGVVPDVDHYKQTNDFVETITQWSTNRKNGITLFSNSLAAKAMFEKYKKNLK